MIDDGTSRTIHSEDAAGLACPVLGGGVAVDAVRYFRSVSLDGEFQD
jgi:hypothetical protein